MEERDFYLGFSVFTDIGPKRFRLLLDYFGTAEKAWKADAREFLQLNLNRKIISILVNLRRRFSIESYKDNLKRKNISFFTLIDHDYPSLLKEINDAPIVFYFRGNKSLLNSKNLNIAIVGTRKMTVYGKNSTQKIVSGFKGQKVTIVSGLAQGIDTIAHKAAVENGIVTIAVLGSGIDQVYPPANYDLYWEIVKRSGLIISEYPPGFRPTKSSFPLRNRIISGLSKCVVVVEGRRTSGSIITAKYALEQGRDVFAVPGPINSPGSEGTSYLIKNGASVISDASDVLDDIRF